VAPLKCSFWPWPAHASIACFHAYKSVAPLKFLRSFCRPNSRSMFPRLQKRGPIEAARQPRAVVRAPGFHAYKSVAPLKLTERQAERLNRVVFPRLQKRGPIEAKGPRLQKRGNGMFPRLQKRGPIEARVARARARARAGVSTLTKAWPH